MLPSDYTPRNRLLSALPPASLARLLPHLQMEELSLRQVLYKVEVPIATVYFPETGWSSMLGYMEDGDAAEVGLMGPEGMVGLPVLLGDDHDDLEAIVQCSGTALSLGAEIFRAAMEDDRALRNLMLRYALVHHGQVARTAICNGHHHTEQRLARWLLMAHDRAEGESFPMTHEFLSLMLGIRRAGVTVAAGILQKAQLIRYERGQVMVMDRPGLENASCECYGITRRALDRLFASAPGKPPSYRR